MQSNKLHLSHPTIPEKEYIFLYPNFLEINQDAKLERNCKISIAGLG
jgi:hypothetical protein